MPAPIETHLTDDEVERIAKRMITLLAPMLKDIFGSKGDDVSGFVSKKDVAQLFGVSTKTIDDWTKKGTIPQPVRVGGLVRWRRAEIVGL